MAKKVTKKKTPTKKKATTKKRAAAPRKAKTVAAATAKPAVTPVIPVSDEQIRLRAFEIYRAGKNPANPDADWLQAEQELTAGVAS